MIDEPNRDHRCRTCEHWYAPFSGKNVGKFPCSCPVPDWVENSVLVQHSMVPGDHGESCGAYSCSSRRARLVKP